MPKPANVYGPIITESPAISPYGKFNRGVAVGYGLVFFGTMDNHVVALDAVRY